MTWIACPLCHQMSCGCFATPSTTGTPPAHWGEGVLRGLGQSAEYERGRDAAFESLRDAMQKGQWVIFDVQKYGGTWLVMTRRDEVPARPWWKFW